MLSEVPELWSAEVRRWRAIARRFKRDVDGQAAPDRNDEYLLYQTLVGAWPPRDADEPLEVFTDRIRAYMEKATKEAKVHTSWVNPYRRLRRRGAGIRHAPARAGQSLPRREPPVPGDRRPRRRRQLTGADAAQDHRPGHPRLLPGLRALGSLAGRPRQSPSGRLRAAAVGARRSGRAHRRRVVRLERARDRAPRGAGRTGW